ncbi:hypothetical protein LTR36_005052 [Oleoguttula mirabilis]|uniref:Integral membrane protein n=1 Tax=Oleoguttula mirabilis TaxID=1507867 RepID=A0AAV9JVW9_9PEZI|nr:hypothetical protein LTR36_005052 [Oleoguttula mirabilis]
MFGRKKKPAEQAAGLAEAEGGNTTTIPPNDYVHDSSNHSDRTLTNDFEPSKAQIKRATRTRLIWALLASFLLLLSVIFIILVELGDTKTSKTLTNIYFLRLDLTNIIPLSVPDAALVNSVAQTLGLHDFYTVGLWGYCEGDNGQGVTGCSKPKTLYWFNPVEIIESELLAGASIALPAQITTILGLIRTVSHWMFGLYLAGACLAFIMIFLAPLSVRSRWATFPITLFTFLAALCTTVASVIATVLFIIAQRAVTSVTQINIGASIGVEMFVFMWIGAGTAIAAWLILWGQCCCCASRRDVRRGKKRGSKKAWGEGEGPVVGSEKAKKTRGGFGRKKQEV